MSTTGRNELSEELTEFLALKVIELSRKDRKSGNATSSIMALKAKGVDGSADSCAETVVGKPTSTGI